MSVETTSTTQLFAEAMTIEHMVFDVETMDGVAGTITPAPDSVPKSLPTGKLDSGWLPAMTPAGIGAVPETRRIVTGTGLTGGGDLTADRTLSVTYGSVAGTACQGDDTRLTDSRVPVSHAATHGATGTDTLTPAQIGAVSLGDTRLSDTRIPKAHAASHAIDGMDTITPAALGAVASTDSRLSDTRVPKAHAASHAIGGTDVITPASIGAQPAGDYQPAGVYALDTDPRLSDARTPVAHADSHRHSGTDELATETPAPYAIPKADAQGRLDAWINTPTAWSVGDIKMWYGELDTTGKYPLIGGVAQTQWHVCDGTDGTPDMQDRVPVGTSATKRKGTTGGSETHSHTVSVSVSNHSATSVSGNTASAYSGVSSSTASASTSGSVGSTTLSTTQIPSHNHKLEEQSSSIASGNLGAYGVVIPNTSTRGTHATGGSGSHTHSFSGSSHSHSISASTHAHSVSLSTPELSHTASGSADSASTLQPYVALHFLMYIGE